MSRRAGPILLGNRTRPESGCGTSVRRGGTLLLLLLLSACASVPLPVSVTAMMQMQLKERAGIYPDEWTIAGASHEAQYVRLAAWTEAQGIVVSEADLTRRQLRGCVQPGHGGWVILLHRGLSPNGKLQTLLHELGHVYGPKASTEADRETIAELVAALVCARVGLNVWPEVTAYVATRAPVLEAQSRIVQLHGVRIDRLVDRLTVAVTSGR